MEIYNKIEAIKRLRDLYDQCAPTLMRNPISKVYEIEMNRPGLADCKELVEAIMRFGARFYLDKPIEFVQTTGNPILKTNLNFYSGQEEKK
jgi:hypothetical protein